MTFTDETFSETAEAVFNMEVTCSEEGSALPRFEKLTCSTPAVRLNFENDQKLSAKFNARMKFSCCLRRGQNPVAHLVGDEV